MQCVTNTLSYEDYSLQGGYVVTAGKQSKGVSRSVVPAASESSIWNAAP